MARYKLRVLTRPGHGLGFRLAGAPVEEIEERDAAARIAALLADPSLGVLAVEEALLAHVPAHLLERVRRVGLPVVLPFPVPTRWGQAGRGEDYVAALLRRAIGYHVRIPR